MESLHRQKQIVYGNVILFLVPCRRASPTARRSHHAAVPTPWPPSPPPARGSLLLPCRTAPAGPHRPHSPRPSSYRPGPQARPHLSLLSRSGSRLSRLSPEKPPRGVS